MIDDFTPSRRSFLAAAAAGVAAITVGDGLAARAVAGTVTAEPTGPILKPLPEEWFYDYGTNAEMRWDSVDPSELPHRPAAAVRPQPHQSTPVIDRTTYALRVYGDGLATPRGEDRRAVPDPRRTCAALPTTAITSVHECTGNGRSFFGSQQGTAGIGHALEARCRRHRRSGRACGCATCCSRVGLSPDAVSIQATGLDPQLRRAAASTTARSAGRSRSRKALDDAILAWGMNGEPLLPDHGYPLRLVLPGWVGIGSIKWLGLARGLAHRAHLAVEHQVVPDDRRRLPGRHARR